MWQSWVIAILGLWTIAVPFLGLSTGGFTWALVVTGIIEAILGFWGASQTSGATARWGREQRV